MDRRKKYLTDFQPALVRQVIKELWDLLDEENKRLHKKKLTTNYIRIIMEKSEKIYNEFTQ